jgi:hypothetical protein
MTAKVFALDTKPGIQRDGTVFDQNYYTDGEWVRFQRGRARKMGGFAQFTASLAGPSRGIYADPQDGITNVYSGYSYGMQLAPIASGGLGTGIQDLTLSNFTPNLNNLWQFDSIFDSAGTGVQNLIAHPGQNIANIDSSANTPVLYGAVSGTTLSKIGVFSIAGCTKGAGAASFTLPAASTRIKSGQSVTGTGLDPATVVTSVSGTTVNISPVTTAAGAFTATFDNNISVSGGVVVLHPYVFVYGNYGYLANSGPSDVTDWASATSNVTNVTATKIVKGLPVRGGSNAPSGLFWSLDSLIRVSFTPTTVTAGVTSSTFYWRYDIVSSQSSVLSSSSIIEYDGVYYWCGVDRFLMYNGTVREIPNEMNQNYFFDNLNYDQRQKVWVSKVPRFGEIWWYYPKGNATECTDAIIYNTRYNIWYDAGEADGARRSAGFYSQVFQYPINAGWDATTAGALDTITLISGGAGYTNGTYPFQALTGGTGTGATATFVVAGGIITSVTLQQRGQNYTQADALSASIPGGAGLNIYVTYVQNQTQLWQHEYGVDKVRGTIVEAIRSSFTTSDLGLVAGGPSNPEMVGINKWLRLERVEPDFVQSGEMSLFVTGRPYAQAADVTSDAYTFDPDTTKIDMKEQRRELRLILESNTQGGNYELGKLLLSADVGDVRGY